MTARARKPHGLAAFLADRRGGPALEFGLIATPVLTMMFYIVMVGLQLYTQTSMDLATLSAARQIRIGNQRGANDSGVRAIICSQMVAYSGSCTGTLQIYVTSGTSFSSLTKASIAGSGLNRTGFNPGVASQFVLVQVAYPTTNLLPFMPTAPVFLSNAVFQNET